MNQKPCSFSTQITKTVDLNYLLFLPPEYGTAPTKKWPLILFLHGMGERGDDLELVKKHGPAKILEEKDPCESVAQFIVVSPQCPDDSFWPAETGALNALLDNIVESYAVDTSRIYLTGLSMGGYGTWHLAVEHPERFAAIAPICGGAIFSSKLVDKMDALKDVPVWAFHGARDRTVSVAESADLVSALEKCGGDIKFTIYPDAEHDSWTETYANPELYAWFLRHEKI